MVAEPILDKEAKLKYLNQYLNKYSLEPEESMCVGDGANDIDMIVNSGMGVSFNGKKALKDVADLNFDYTNLLGLLYAQGYSDKEIIS
jgi:phosphoserine phosphatase